MEEPRYLQKIVLLDANNNSTSKIKPLPYEHNFEGVWNQQKVEYETALITHSREQFVKSCDHQWRKSKYRALDTTLIDIN